MVKEVVAHLKEFGLVAKILESLDGGGALVLKSQQDAPGRLDFHRGNEIPKMKERLFTGAILDVQEINWALLYCWLAPNSLQLHQEVSRR